MQVKRFDVSLEEDMLNAFDKLVLVNQFPNRSQAICFLIKSIIVT